MKTKFATFLLFVCMVQAVAAQHIYFFAGGNRNLKRDEITILHKNKNNENTKYKMVYDWIRIDVSKGKHDLQIKSSEFDQPKLLSVDLTKENALFFEINLSDTSWKVLKKSKEEAPTTVTYDFEVFEKENNLTSRLKDHPKTKWDTQSLKKYLTSKNEGMEGIYEVYSKHHSKSSYTLGIVKNGSNYDIIYLSGGNDNWKQGDLKGRLITTGAENTFKVDWYMSDKFLEKDHYAEFYEKNRLGIVLSNQTLYYIKTFPVVD
ncbi:hypothetical protein [Aquimarina algicola]|uniref:DUF4198 domain-containing protein n=1 Tax=Aquimarina algicola TaxID=2589995 RepID=A0A504J8H2_9FLAO|nr:hypothetical protein [Aquimarina algicola]TPN86874.1 hypothetical protein FHK87_04530 [Aquimarina algicola]